MIWLDFETRSRCDLRSAGVYNYVQDLSTDVLCMSYAFGDGDVQTWLPDQPLPDLTGHRIMAHNAAFERLVLWYVLQINIPLEQFYCTATQARQLCTGVVGRCRAVHGIVHEERPPGRGLDPQDVHSAV